MRKIILASASPQRKDFLEKAGLIFEVIPSNYEEDMTLPLLPDELVKFLSKEKAKSVADDFEDAIIISADTIVSFEDKIIGKPHTVEKARETLKILSGNTHFVYTGFTIIDTKSKKIISEAVETKVVFKELSLEIIDDYIEKDRPLKYAGSYTLNDIFNKFIEKIEGDHSNVIGLPVDSVMKALESFGVKV